MRWSQLKQRIEGRLAPAVQGRVEVWTTRYRGSHDAAGEGWITLDGERLWGMGTLAYVAAQGREAQRLRAEGDCADYRDPARYGGYMDAARRARARVQADGVFSLEDLDRALFASLNLSIDAALASPDPIIRAFAMLDRRLGKRRLARLEVASEHPLVQALHRVRWELEGLGAVPTPGPAGPVSGLPTQGAL